MTAVNVTGQRFGRLVALEPLPRVRGRGQSTKWRCLCDCGAISTPHVSQLRSGHARSCGCLQQDVMRARSTKHGQVGTPTYRAWQAMISRVTQCGNSSFKNYGGRGITVCERWRDYEAFYADMGEKPAGKTLDRKNNNGNYEPTNCRWATKEEQDNNKRTSVYVTFNGQTRTLSQWGRVLKTDPGILRRRWIKFQTLNPIPRKGPTNGSNRDASGRFKANS